MISSCGRRIVLRRAAATHPGLGRTGDGGRAHQRLAKLWQVHDRRPAGRPDRGGGSRGVSAYTQSNLLPAASASRSFRDIAQTSSCLRSSCTKLADKSGRHLSRRVAKTRACVGAPLDFAHHDAMGTGDLRAQQSENVGPNLGRLRRRERLCHRHVDQLRRALGDPLLARTAGVTCGGSHALRIGRSGPMRSGAALGAEAPRADPAMVLNRLGPEIPAAVLTGEVLPRAAPSG